MKTWQKLKRNPQLWERYFIREKTLTAIRRFFRDREFHEIETPYLTGTLPPESYLDVFETKLLGKSSRQSRIFLPTSPEPFIKKLLVAGIGNCFSISKSFRNTQDFGPSHNPEFTILEWYRVNSDYNAIMRDCEELLVFINVYLTRTVGTYEAKKPTEIVYQGKCVDLHAPWEKITVAQAFDKYAHINLRSVMDTNNIASIARSKGYTVRKSDSWEELYHQIFLNEIEPHLGRGKPTILYEYPIQLAALAQAKKSDPDFAERFEFYIEGLELGDAYSELTDWREQEKRFRIEEKERKRLGKIQHPTDTDFIEALKSGMPQSGGIAVGVDRLIMLFADVTNIADTLFFPMQELLVSS